MILGANLTDLDNLIEGRRKDVEGPTFFMNPDKVGQYISDVFDSNKTLARAARLYMSVTRIILIIGAWQ